jgi:hypothetical protein
MAMLDISLSLHFQACPKPATPHTQTLAASHSDKVDFGRQRKIKIIDGLKRPFGESKLSTIIP